MEVRPRIVFLDWLRFVACFLVMVIHACECIYSNDYSFGFPTETDRWSIACISGFARPAVPLFLMASAYLLVPVKQDLLGFYRRRLSRVFIPFAIWLVLYAVLPAAWGEWGWAESAANLKQVFINFIPRESHLWFIYMLLGIYFIMPILSPWLEKCSKRDEQVMLGIWLFTTFFWHFHETFGAVFGECWWNPWPTFHYVSGYVGFVVLAHYIRTHLDWSRRKVFAICIPLFVLGWAWCVYSFYTRSFRVEEVRFLELDWQTTSIAPALMSFAAFALFKEIKTTPPKLFAAVQSVSLQSYGMYLMHMMMLPAWFGVMRPRLWSPLGIFATAAATYVSCYILCLIASRIPVLRRAVG